jgi:hypothetical protein
MLRWWAMKPPPARSRTSVSLTGVSAKAKSSSSLARGSLATVIWYLIERACFSESSAVSRSPTILCGSCWRLTVALEARLRRDGDDLVVGRLHAEELQPAHRRQDLGPLHHAAHHAALLRLS